MNDNESQWSSYTGLSRISNLQPMKQGPACIMQVQTNTHLWNGQRRVRYCLADKTQERPIVGSLLRIYKWRIGEFQDEMLIEAYQNLGGALIPMIKAPFWARSQPKFTQTKKKELDQKLLVPAQNCSTVEEKTLAINFDKIKQIFYKEMPIKMPQIIDLSDD